MPINVSSSPTIDISATLVDISSSGPLYISGAAISVLSGTLAVSQTNPVLTASVTQGGAWAALVSGSVTAAFTATVPVVVTSSTTGTVTSQPLTLTGVALLAANAARKGATVYNLTTQDLYVRLGTTATLTNFTVVLPMSGYYEVPYGYNGAIWGLNSTGGLGVAYVTEVA